MQDQLIVSGEMFVNDAILADANAVQAYLTSQFCGAMGVRVGRK